VMLLDDRSCVSAMMPPSPEPTPAAQRAAVSPICNLCLIEFDLAHGGAAYNDARTEEGYVTRFLPPCAR
jgi:hypothetical protein